MNSLLQKSVTVMLAIMTAFTSFAAFHVSAEASDKTLRVRFYDDPSGFDPARVFRIENETIAFNIFSGLTTYDSKTGKLVPDLAESWETKDNTTWTFKLRRGVKWQKGFGEFTSADVVYSYNRILAPETASPYRSEFANIKSLTAPDDYTVVIVLDQPDASFLHKVANYHQGQIVNQKSVEAAGKQFGWQPVGTGPYYLDSIDVKSRFVLKRHEDYFRGKAPISTIVFQIIKNESTSTIALRRGEVDLVMRSRREENLETLEREGFVMNRHTGYAVAQKIFNTTFKPFSDARVRQAVAYALDYEAINKAVAPRLQSTTHSMLMPWMDVYSTDIPKYDYNPELAKKLLREAGYPNGFAFKQLSTAANGVTEFQQFEIDYLGKVGIKMSMELVDSPTYNQRRNRGEFEATTRLLPAVDPYMLLDSFLNPENFPPKGLNGARYDNPRVTELLKAVRSEVDEKKRLAMYAEIQKIVMTDLPYLPQYGNGVVWPGKKNVVGVTINNLAQVNFFEVDIQ
jgi:peptide/nickel transport system substrate-binding protein